MQRRQFLKNTSVALAATLTGCGGGDDAAAVQDGPASAPSVPPAPAPPPPPPSTAGSPPPPSTAGYWDIPSLQDEINFYANTNKVGGAWAWTAADRAFDFSAANPLPAIPATGGGRPEIHSDMEGDDLWTWEQQFLRGYVNPALISDATQRGIVQRQRDKWFQYHRDNYLINGMLVNDSHGDGTNTSGHFCHIFNHGLCLYGVKHNDSAALAAAEAIGDAGLAYKWNGVNEYFNVSNPVGSASGRAWARMGMCVLNLAEAIGSSKWINSRNQFIERFMNATDWMESPTLGMISGTGFYYLPNLSDGGIRQQQTFYMGGQATFLWHAYLQTGRADVKARLIKLAYFMMHYGFDPSHAIPLCGAKFGHNNGAIYHPSPNGNDYASHDFSVVGGLVWGYKLTGDIALLNSAKAHFRQASKYRESYPRRYGAPNYTGTGAHVADNEVWSFLDVKGHSSSGYLYFTWNKGALQYAYPIFENGGNPALIP